MSSNIFLKTNEVIEDAIEFLTYNPELRLASNTWWNSRGGTPNQVNHPLEITRKIGKRKYWRICSNTRTTQDKNILNRRNVCYISLKINVLVIFTSNLLTNNRRYLVLILGDNKWFSSNSRSYKTLTCWLQKLKKLIP